LSALGVIRFKKPNKPTLTDFLAKQLQGQHRYYQRFGRATLLVIPASDRCTDKSLVRLFAESGSRQFPVTVRIVFSKPTVLLTGSDKIQRSQHRDSYVVGWQIINQFMNWFASSSSLFRGGYIGIGKIRLFQSSQAIEIKSSNQAARSLCKGGIARNGFDLVATAHENTGLSIANLSAG